MSAGGFGASFANSYPLWVFFRWIMAFGSLGMKTAKCIMGVEMVGGKWRSIVMIGFYHVCIPSKIILMFGNIIMLIIKQNHIILN